VVRHRATGMLESQKTLRLPPGEDAEPLSKELLSMGMAQRWEKVGESRLEIKPVDPRRPNSFLGMEHISFHDTGYTNGEQRLDPATRPRRFVKVEAGSSLRFLKSNQANLPDADEILSRPNFPDIIRLGFQSYKQGEYFQMGGTMQRYGSLGLLAADEMSSDSKMRRSLTVSDIRRSQSSRQRSAQVDILRASPWGSNLSASLGSLPSTAHAAPKLSKAESRKRLAVLGDFQRWMLRKNLDVDQLWCLLTEALTCTEDGFISSLQASGFPVPEESILRLFRYIDVDCLGQITRDDVQTALENFVLGPVLSPKMPKEAAVNTDPFRIAVPEGSFSNLVHAFPMRLKAVREEDPVVGQLMAFLTQNFHTIGEAFQIINVNGNPRVSKTEFVDGLRELRSPKGRNPLAEHLRDLYNRMDVENIGSMVPEDIVYILLSAHQRKQRANPDPLIERLALYLLAYAPDKQPPGNNSDKDKLEQLLGAHGKPSLGPVDFIKELVRLRYDHWHLGDLFCRLDKDHQGLLTKEKFSAYLEPEKKHVVQVVAPKRRAAAASAAQVDGHRSSIDEAVAPSRSVAESRQGELGTAKQKSGMTAGLPSSSLPLLNQEPPRPDHMSRIRRELDESRAARQGRSKLNLHGSHQFLSNSEPQLDLAKPVGALQHFDVNEPRTRYTVVP